MSNVLQSFRFHSLLSRFHIISHIHSVLTYFNILRLKIPCTIAVLRKYIRARSLNAVIVVGVFFSLSFCCVPVWSLALRLGLAYMIRVLLWKYTSNSPSRRENLQLGILNEYIYCGTLLRCHSNGVCFISFFFWIMTFFLLSNDDYAKYKVFNCFFVANLNGKFNLKLGRCIFNLF